MKKIPVAGGKWALVDDEDAFRIGRFKWRFDGRYALTTIKVRRGLYRQRRMHALVLRTPAGMHTDHINGKGLDNRKANLRACTLTENLANSGKRRQSRNPFKGITKHGNKWRARFRTQHLGLFPTAEAAARAYDAATKAAYGEFARANIPG